MNDKAQWLEINEKHLAATLAWIRLRLQRLAESPAEPIKDDQQSSHGWFKRDKTTDNKRLPAPSSVPSDEALELARQEMVELENNDPPPALNLLTKYLGLSKFDRHVLALCAAMELDTRIASLCAKAQGDINKPYPTFALAFALFEDPDWNTLSPPRALAALAIAGIKPAGHSAFDSCIARSR